MTEAGKKRTSTSYRVYLSPETIDLIRQTADELGVSHTKLASIWVSETVHKKRAELGFVAAMQQAFQQQMADAIGEMDAEGESETTEAA